MAKVADSEVTDDLGGDVESNGGVGAPTHVKRLVNPAAMKPWDFETWKDCADHLLAEHPVSV